MKKQKLETITFRNFKLLIGYRHSKPVYFLSRSKLHKIFVEKLLKQS